MIYRKLSLLSFGKFKNKHIYLQDGLNLILGDNETGKSTIHHFIEGMLYGFFSYGKKRKSYEELQNKYKPWTSDEYAGAMTYENDGSLYMIERNFSEINARVKVSNYTTGEDITNKFDFNEITRMYEPINHLNLSKLMYRNTVSIGQLNIKTDKSLAEEVSNLMANIDTGFSEISVISAVKSLREAAEKIAGKKGEIKQVGQINHMLEELKAEKEEAQQAALYDKKLKIEIENLSKKLEKIKKYEAVNKLKSIKKYEELNNEIIKTKQLLQDIKPVEGFDEDSFERIIILDNEVRGSYEKLNEYKQKINDIQNETDSIKTEIYKNTPDDNYEELKRDYEVYNQIKEGILTKPQTGADNIFLALFVLLSAAATYLFLNSLISYAFISAAAAILSVIIFIVKKAGKKRFDTDKIYKKYGFKNEYEFEKYCSLKKQQFEKCESDKMLLQIKSNEYDKAIHDINKIKEEYETKSNILEKTLNNMGLSKSMPYREVLKTNKVYKELKNKLANLELLKNGIMSQKEYNILKEKVGSFEINIDELNIEQPDEDKETILSKLSHLQGVSDNNLKNVRSLTEIMSEIKELTKKRDELLTEFGALNLAADVIEEAAKEMHSQNSPLLNKKISEFIYSITNKYKVIKLTNNLEINVENPETSFMVGVDELSQGTLEQLYFSLRMALAEIFAPDAPIIMDDSFVMYDSTRLENIIRVLYNISEKRQILLFSCSSREKDILDKLKLDYHMITL